MWEAEREFEIYEEVHGYQLEDESTDDMPDTQLDASSDANEDSFGYYDDFYDDDDRYDE
jgi:hypothetical protein